MAADRLIPVRVGDIEIEVETVPMAGTEPTLGRRAAGNVVEAFGRAQDAIIEVARSTAQMIERAGSSARVGAGNPVTVADLGIFP